MAKTQIADIIVPEVFNPYVIERTAELTEIIMGGMVTNDPMMNELAEKGGNTINMPFYTDLTGDDEILSDSGSLTPGKIETGQDVAVLLMRGRAWSVNDLAKALSGDDPMKAIGDLVADYWVRKQQAALISMLTGVYADNLANDSGDMINDISQETTVGLSADNYISDDAVIDTITGTMGDAWDRISGMAMHSVVFTNLQKQDLIVYVPTSEQNISIPTYLGRRVLVDDTCHTVPGTTSGTRYYTYMFGEGSVAMGDGGAPVPVETDRDTLAGDDILITRRHYLIHPRGVKHAAGSVSGSSPTNAELELAVNHDRVYERKNVRHALLITNG